MRRAGSGTGRRALLEGWLAYLLLFAAGCAAGTLNVVAGGGSFLTLPVMIFLGLPPTVANGTNRVAILVQNAGAVWGFHRHRIVRRAWIALAAVPATAGAILGTWAAVEIGEQAFQRALAVIMIVVSLWAIWDPMGKRPVGESLKVTGGPARLGLAAAFFLVGAYGGFVQAGIGFLLLAVTTAAGLDLVRGNALKVLVILIFTPVSLALFALSGKVEWGLGLALAAGNLAGGLAGVHITIRKGHEWIKRAVTVVVILFAIKLWISP